MRKAYEKSNGYEKKKRKSDVKITNLSATLHFLGSEHLTSCTTIPKVHAHLNCVLIHGKPLLWSQIKLNHVHGK